MKEIAIFHSMLKWPVHGLVFWKKGRPVIGFPMYDGMQKSISEQIRIIKVPSFLKMYAKDVNELHISTSCPVITRKLKFTWF